MLNLHTLLFLPAVETGVKLFRRGNRSQLLAGFDPGIFGVTSKGRTFIQEVVVNNATGIDLVLEVTDSFGDGSKFK